MVPRFCIPFADDISIFYRNWESIFLVIRQKLCLSN
jgi:hypothetical protein